MGYEVHITRADDWMNSEGNPISLDEWIAYVRSDPEMRLDGFAEVTLQDGRVLRTEGEGLAVWTAYSGDGVDGNHAWFDHWEGRIVVKSPDEEIVDKMIEIARSLGARVFGDDGEAYTQLRSESLHTPDGDERESPRRGWLARLFGRQ